MTKQILAFFFLLHKRAKPYPLPLSIYPPIPHTPLKPKAEGFIELRSRLYKTFGFNLRHLHRRIFFLKNFLLWSVCEAKKDQRVQ